MIYSNEAREANQKESNEAACKILGHAPQPATRPASFGEMTDEIVITCQRCGKKI